MFLLSKSIIRILPRRHCSTAANRLTWQLHAATCVQRPAIVSTDITPQQQEFQKYFSELDEEASVMSDFELHQKEDARIDELRKRDDIDELEGLQNRLTAFELEKQWEQQVAHVQLASRLTEEDKSNNLKSANRVLQRPLTLLVQQQFGGNWNWTFPQAAWQEGESLRQTAERGLRELCGIQAHYLGNAPCGYFKYKFPSSVQEELQHIGVKVFIFKAQVLDRHVTLRTSEDVRDHKWLTKDAITEDNLKNTRLVSQTNKFVMEL